MQALYPVHQLMQFVSLAAPPPERGMYAHGALAITLAQREHRRAGTSRLHLVMRLPRPGWGSLNITGDVRGWSFTAVLSQARQSRSINFHMWLAEFVRLRLVMRLPRSARGLLNITGGRSWLCCRS